MFKCGLNVVLRNSPQWYDIVHFDHNFTTSLINPKLADVGPVNNFSLIEARLFFWSLRTKYTLSSTLLVTFDYTFEAHNTLFDIWGFYWHG